MLFSSIKSSSSQSKTSSTCDVFAVACDLKSQLHTIEERLTQGQEINDELKRKRDELQEVLRLFEMIEENERKVSNELEEELEQVLKDIPYERSAAIRLDPSESMSSMMEPSAARRRPAPSLARSSDKENYSNLDRHARTQTGDHNSSSFKTQDERPFKPRVVIPPRWKKVIAMSLAATLKDRQPITKPAAATAASTSAPTLSPALTTSDSLIPQPPAQASPSQTADATSLLSTDAFCGGAVSFSKVTQAVSLKSAKPKRTSSKNWSNKPYKARKQSKAPKTTGLGIKAGPPPADMEGVLLGPPLVRTRTIGLGALGGQWNATANANDNQENVNPFGY